MAVLAVLKDGVEFIFPETPTRRGENWISDKGGIELPKGSIEKMIGKKLTWEDEPFDTEKGYQEKWWIARDKSGELNAFESIPIKGALGYWKTYEGETITLPSRMFPEITWDDEPKHVKVTISL